MQALLGQPIGCGNKNVGLGGVGIRIKNKNIDLAGLGGRTPQIYTMCHVGTCKIMIFYIHC